MSPIAMAVAMALAFAIFIYSIHSRWRLMNIGAPENRFDQLGTRLKNVFIIALPQPLKLNFIKPVKTGLKRPQGLLQAFIEVAANGHHLAHRFHRGGEQRISPLKLLKVSGG